VISIDDKIAVIDGVVGTYNWARKQPGTPEYNTLMVLKAIHADVRAQHPVRIGQSLAELTKRVDACKAHKRPDGNYELWALQALAQEVIGRWSVIRQALEKYGDHNATLCEQSRQSAFRWSGGWSDD
jgi:hypothetical protein